MSGEAPAPSGILVLGCGNPGRRDDGLGPAFIDRTSRLDLPGVTAEAGFQLNVEDALEVSHHAKVVFVDASLVGPEPYEMRPLKPSEVITFTTHKVSAESVLALAQDHFGSRAEAWQLGIRGYDFDIGDDLSPRAAANLEEALRFLEGWCSEAASGDEQSGRPCTGQAG